ncbi:unnamed protein product [Linum tenue]|uniref:Uncharacterized protein n=1 Tax=Linum tenue TaxID=586396 RepID=A0AAV0RGP6_9ROSI|nr:unnamed protein product [Linum tenue]
MKSSNIFLLFLLTFLVVGGNEVAMATRNVEGSGFCQIGTAQAVPVCSPETCNVACKLKYGNGETTIGFCGSDQTCNCFRPC